MSAEQRVPHRATVVVVGGGPSGVTAANLLADAGVDVLVLDRFDEVYPRPRAVAMDDEVHRIVARMGLADDYEKISRPALGLRLVDASDRSVLAEFPRSVEHGVHGFPESSLFDQPVLEGVLRTGLARRPLARLCGGVDVTAVTPHEFTAEGAVTVEFTDRASGERGSVLADWVLGCDGANSLVRGAVGGTMQDLGFTQRWLVADVSTDADLDQWEGIHQVCSPDRGGTFMRIGERRYRWEFQLRGDESATDFATVGALRPLLLPWLRGTPDEELTLLRITDYTFRAQVSDRWRRGRMFLLGDAAHLTPPFIGQGMGAGLRDAANLSWKLAAVLQGRQPESVLDSYETERRPHARAMVRKGVTVGRIMTGGGRLGDLARRAVAPRIPSIPGARERLGSATPRLHRSSLVRTGRLHHGLAGTLCPNAELSGVGRFDDQVDHRLTLVTDLPVGGGRERQVERAGVRLVAVEPTDPLGRWLAGAGAHAAVVRPDGTVLAAGESLDRTLAAAR